MNCTSVRVGNHLGKGDTIRAEVAAHASIMASVIIGTLNATVVLFNKHWWGHMFTSEPEVLTVADKVLPILALLQLADGIKFATAGCLAGAGRPVGLCLNRSDVMR